VILLGLTGSIGMGKSETTKIFRRLGVPVYDADAAVHALYARGGAAVPRIAVAFPDAVKHGSVDRAALSRLVVGNEAAIKQLERLVHPLVGLSRQRFLKAARARRLPLVVLDIPLLFETGGQRRVDCVVVVSAPASVQRQRVLQRSGMTAEKFAGILARQVPDKVKRAKADFIVPTGLGKRVALQRVRRIVRAAAGLRRLRVGGRRRR
jgi:dephospho-CoA kinase